MLRSTGLHYHCTGTLLHGCCRWVGCEGTMELFGIGAGELFLIMVLALVVIGPERLPEVAGQVVRMTGDATFGLPGAHECEPFSHPRVDPGCTAPSRA